MHYELTLIQSIFFNHFIQMVFLNLFTLYLYHINTTSTKYNYNIIHSIFFLLIIEIIGKEKFSNPLYYITKVSNKNYFFYFQQNRISLEQEEEEEKKKKKKIEIHFLDPLDFQKLSHQIFHQSFHLSLISLPSSNFSRIRNIYNNLNTRILTDAQSVLE